ncbi:MAG: hypothetical protein MUC95_06215 [Spirochaetes bacterium]|nr:hypothetical protein [Spirochaetota bacterium]
MDIVYPQVSVTVDLEEFVPADAAMHCYLNVSLTADKETELNTVRVTDEIITLEDHFVATIPANSLIRIDF